MPIYEFFCSDCNTIFNFYSPRVNTEKIPSCPKCQKKELKRLLSKFATFSSKNEKTDEEFPGKQEKFLEAIHQIENEIKSGEEGNPAALSAILRKLNKNLGLKMNEKLEEALAKMEAGENPEKIISEIEDYLTPEMLFEAKKTLSSSPWKKIKYDDTLYEL
jgi:putative FmdB family regulatory protein